MHVAYVERMTHVKYVAYAAHMTYEAYEACAASRLCHAMNHVDTQYGYVAIWLRSNVVT